MAQYIFHTDIVLKDNAFLELGFEMSNASVLDEYKSVFNRERALSLLRGDSGLAARFLSQTKGNGTIYWSGAGSDIDTPGGSAGVTVVRRRGGEEAIGDNAFGRFLDDVRHAFRQELSDLLVDEVEVRPGQVVTDFTRKGAYMSDIEERERSGESFIHVDVYRPARFRFDAGRDGTTGHAERKSDDEVPFHKFVCPFGTSYPSPVIVGSAAEASVLYEQAIRGEIDWKALFENLRERGLLDPKLSDKQITNLIADYRAQFDWMREEIVNNPSLRNMTIVGSSWMVPDSSMGRSVYDAQLAPSPAHVLARYINNPLLLYSTGENGVLRSLGLLDKDEPERFAEAKDGTVNIIVSGSDTIGGREPGRKAVTKTVRNESVDRETGQRVITTSRRPEIPMKTREASDEDYRMFSARMDSILSGLGEGVTVRLIAGNASSMGDTVGVGTPQMVARYVREHGGDVFQYDFVKRAPLQKGENKSEDRNDRLSVILMPHFAECMPVLIGEDASVEFRLDQKDDESVVTFNDASLQGDGLVCFSDSQDYNNRNVLGLASLAYDAGLPVVHVQNRQDEETQRRNLADGALISRSGYAADIPFEGDLFERVDTVQWDLNRGNHLSEVDDQTGLHYPVVFRNYPSPALVEGYSFKSVFGTFLALAHAEEGTADADTLRVIARAEGSSSQMMGLYNAFLDGRSLDEHFSLPVQERLLRRSVRMVCDANTAFRDVVMDTGKEDIVMSSNSGDTTLFVSPDGEGLNRFALAMAAERDMLVSLRDGRRLAEEQERARLLDEAAKRQKLSNGSRADGQKVVGGLPRSVEEAKDAVWFIGTNNPIQLSLDDNHLSFEMWDDLGGDDPLVREKAARSYVEDGEGNHIDNKYMFLFPTDLESFTGRKSVKNIPDSKNLTGVMREDPETGEKYLAAVGIPVRFNNRGLEKMNDDNLPCSYRMDDDTANFSASIVLSDSKARSIAIRHGLALSLPGRIRNGSDEAYYTLGQVFMEKHWGVYDEDGHKKKGWVNNPHHAPLNLSMVNSYIALLESGSRFPLNCIPMPRAQYFTQSDAVVKARLGSGERFISAEGRFISDLMLSLKIANATAIALGVPLRFPLDKDGHIDLGPGVPDEYRLMAEKRIDSFIGVKNEQEQLKGTLPVIERVPLYEAREVRDLFVKAGTDLYMKPNDLAVAFGPYDFSSILSGQITVPLHEMLFRTEDGTFFKLTDSVSTKGLDAEEINKYLSYSKNREPRRFIIRTTDPSKTEAFIEAVKAYSERAKAIQVEARLVRETDMRNAGMEGFVNLLSSNSDEFAMSEHDIGREMTFYNAGKSVKQTYVRDLNGKSTGRIDESVSERDIDGNKVEEGYWGKVEAKDGFRGYAQIRYTLPNGEESPWTTITDLELAKDTVLSMVNRTYRTDTRAVPSASVLEMLHKAAAVKMAGSRFRDFVWVSGRNEVADDKVVSIQRENVSDGSREEPQLKDPVLVVNHKGAWTRNEVAADTKRLYVFTDNTDRTSGKGVIDRDSEYYRRYGDGTNDLYYPKTTAAVLRGLDNAVPVSTQRWYHDGAKGETGRWNDADAEEFRRVVSEEFAVIREKVASGAYEKVVFPEGGLFGGKISAITEERVPVLHGILNEEYERFLAFCEHPQQEIYQTENVIDEFKGENRFLSNFWPCKVVYEGEIYPSVENAYQAAKCSEPKEMEQFRTLSAGGAKQAGKSVSLRADWELVKDDIMYDLVSQKFRNEKLREMLLATGADKIIEGNTWGDTYWGVDLRTGKGDNRLGEILMKVRGEVAEMGTEVSEGVVFSKEKGVITYTESSGGYQQRTRENANADDVDFTLAFAYDFTTYGERATAKAAGDSLIPFEVKDLSSKEAKRAVKEIYDSLPDEFQKGEPFGVNIAGNGIYTLVKKGFTQEDVDRFMVEVLSGLQAKGVVFSSGRSGGQTGFDEAGLAAGRVCGIPMTCHAPKGWLMRDGNGVDYSDEAAFKARLENKDYKSLSSFIVRQPKAVRKSKGQGIGLN